LELNSPSIFIPKISRRLRGSKIEIPAVASRTRARCCQEPIAGLDLAFQAVEAIYAAYLAAAKGMRIEWKG